MYDSSEIPVSELPFPEEPQSEPLPEVRLGRREIRVLLLVVLIVAVFLGLAYWFSLPSTIDEYAWRGLVHLSKDRYEAAAEDFTAAIDLARQQQQPHHIRDLLVYRALAYNNSKQYRRAVDDVTLAIRLESQNQALPFLVGSETTDWYLIRANSHLGLGNFDKATEDARVVLSRSPNNESARHILDEIENRKSDPAGR